MKPIDGFITMSQKVLNDLKFFNNCKPAKYVPHPLYDNFGEKISKQIAREKINVQQDAHIVLFFGFIRHYKGLDILMNAIANFKKNNAAKTNVKFLIAGEFYEDRKPIDDLIKSLQIEDALIMRTDFIPDSEVRNYLCAADVVIQPYRSATQSGVTPLAYHFEIPMIVTNVGGLPALVPDYKVGLIAEPNPISISEKIQEFFSLSPDYFLPGLLEEKQKYSWDVMANEILQLS